MATTKTATLTFRIDSGLKAALRVAAQQEHRSIANMVEVLIRDYCVRNDIEIPKGGLLEGKAVEHREGTAGTTEAQATKDPRTSR